MNRLILVSYTLVAPGRSYPKVESAIKRLNPQSYCSVLDTVWIVPTTMSCAQVAAAIRPTLDSDDKLFVTTAGPDWAAYNLPRAVQTWLN